MHFHLDFRTSDTGRLTIAFLFSLVLHALLLIFVRFVQPAWNSATETTTLNVILEKNVAEVAQPTGIPAATLKSKGEAAIGVQAAIPVPATIPVPPETRPTVTLSQNEPRKTEPSRVPSEEKILAIEKPAKFIVPESKAELPVTKNLPPEITEEKTKPLAPVPSVENLAAKTAPSEEESKKIVAVAPAPETAAVEAPRPAPVEPPRREEPKPVKIEEPKPVKVEESPPPKVEEPKPARIEEPKPLKVEEPKPVGIEEPKPIKLEEPRHARLEEPKPVRIEETKPAKVEEPKPARIEEPKPVKVEEPKPVKVEEPRPPKVEEPKPAKPEIATGPKTPLFGIGKQDGAATRPPAYGAPSQSDFGIGGVRGLPRIADRRIMGGERRKVVDSREQELRYVMYRESVILKLKRIGQLNYPGNLSGKLLIQLSIRADGSLEEVSIVRASPYEALNASAEKVVRMCAPFSPLPDDIKKDTDILTIRINWNFNLTNSKQSLE